MISLDNISKVYRKGRAEVPALGGVTLAIGAGEFVAVRGPSGSGKSTLLMVIAGMARPTAGRVVFDGQDLYSLPACERAAIRAKRIGFVFQMFHLLPYLTVWENVASPLLAGEQATRGDIAALIDRVGLTERAHHRPSELSTGERQRVALARALLKRPEVILADEPTGNLDPDNARQVMEHLAEFHRAGGTVVLVTHEALAEPYAQRTVHLAPGGVIGDDPSRREP
jgi:ABC-type lipoprotein export system ATPase subunit